MLLTKLKSRDIPWKLLTVEAALIVLSVLLALGVDSWREGRAQRALQGFVDEARPRPDEFDPRGRMTFRIWYFLEPWLRPGIYALSA